MISDIYSSGILGVDGYVVRVETFLSSGLPAFDIVGLPGVSVRESRDRVRAALRNCGYEFPMRRITVNLAPADLRKEGPIYDLPILLGLLDASHQIVADFSSCSFFGELSLNGELRPINGVLPMASAVRTANLKSVFVPFENTREAALIEGLTVYGARHVLEIIDHLEGKKHIEPFPSQEVVQNPTAFADFSEVKGQESAKRALEIASAGSHNVIMIGPPGGGKSMLASRLPSILPSMSFEEALETTKIHSVVGLLSRDNPLLTRRPFRSPHHTITPSGLVGGGSSPTPGEITLAHNGVLFLDELTEFDRRTIEVLRQPIEDGNITLARVSGTYTYPSNFMLVCAINPCRCGWLGHPTKQCTCTPSQINAYYNRLSGPLLDRIDIHVEVPPLSYDDLSSEPEGLSSEEIRTRIEKARSIAKDRYKSLGIKANADLPAQHILKYCKLDSDGIKLMKSAFDRLNLTARSYDRILRLSRTIADLECADNVRPHHLAEALQYRQIGGRPL